MWYKNMMPSILTRLSTVSMQYFIAFNAKLGKIMVNRLAMCFPVVSRATLRALVNKINAVQLSI